MRIVSLPFHLFIHFSLAILVGWSVGRLFNKKKLGIIAGFLGGVLIDLDHVLDYFLVFGFHFNLTYFLQGRQFLISDQIRTWFHAWEYIPILLLIAWLCRRYTRILTFLLALALGMFVHLVTDCVINNYPPQNYSLVYRYELNFSAPLLLNDEQRQEYIKDRQELGLPTK